MRLYSGALAGRHLATAVSTAATIALLGFSGCTDAANNASGGREVGSAQLKLVLPSGVQLNSLNYSIDKNSAPVQSGAVPVDNSDEIVFQIGNLAQGSGYGMSLTAMTVAGASCTGGPMAFAVEAHKTALIMMQLHCGSGDTTVASTNGNVRVEVMVDQTTGKACSTVDGLTVVPASVRVGASMQLHGFATGSGASYAWSVNNAAAGMFSAATAADTKFTCATPGSYNVTLTVSSGGTCPSDKMDALVQCTGMSAPTAGTSAPTAGTSAPTAGTSAPTAGTSAPTAGTSAPTAGTSAPTAGTSAPTAGTSAPTAGTSAPTAGTGAPTAGTGGGGGPSAACTTCRDTNCRNFQGSGIDMVHGCLEAVDPSQGANASDPTFIQACMDIMKCAFVNKCATGEQLASGCYCGSATPDACIANGPAADAKCVAEFKTGARVNAADSAAAQNTTVTGRVSDLAYPVGWANFLLQCDKESCASSCTPQ